MIYAAAVQPGTAADVDFFAMNQANKTLGDNSTSIANGDLLYLYDNSSIPSPIQYNWTVNWTGLNGTETNLSQSGKNVIFGPVYTDNSSAVIVRLNVTSISGTWNCTKVYQATNLEDLIRADFTYETDYSKRNSSFPNGTLLLSDATKLQVEPPDIINRWWWKVTTSNGDVLGNWSGSDHVTVGLSNDTYQVNLTVQSERGHIDSESSIVSGMTDYLPPDANFTGIYRNGTSPQVVAFIDQSTGLTNLTYRWDFGDGSNLSNERNPEHTYLNRTLPYSVNLTVTDTFGTSSSLNRTDYIMVSNPDLQANFTAVNRNGTAPLDVTFIDQSSSTLPITSWQWNFGDGNGTSNQQNPEYTYYTNGTYTVNLTVTNSGGEVSNTSQENLINATHMDIPTGMFTAFPRNGQAPLTVKFIDQSQGTQPLINEWDFGDMTRLVHEKSPTHIYEDPGLYTVSMEVSGPYGSDVVNQTDFIEVTVPDRPVARFAAIPPEGLAPFNVTFLDHSLGKNLSYLWDFGTGDTSTERDPIYRYLNSGTYLVYLTVRDEDLRENSTSRLVIIGNDPYPVPGFATIPPSGPAPLNVSFIDQSELDPKMTTPAEYEWEFGDGATSNEKNPVHLYMNPGTFQVNMTVRAGNVNATITGDVVVEVPVPDADFTASPLSGKAPLTVSFIDLSCPTRNCGYNYLWDFGDGGSDDLKQNPVHVYQDIGTYIPTLKVTDPWGISANKTGDPINVSDQEDPLNAEFRIIPEDGRGVAPFSVRFIDASSGSPVGWEYNFGDGTASTDQSPVHEYSSPGTYEVTLEVWNRTGSSDISDPTTIEALSETVVSRFHVKFPDPDNRKIVDFYDASLGDGLNSWKWNFGDGDVSTEQAPEHVYSSDGCYIVTLTVSNGFAESRSLRKLCIGGD